MTEKLLEQGAGGQSVGKNPLNVAVNLLEHCGHVSAPIMKVIRKKCLNCCGYQVGEVRKCAATDCALWPYRMGKNPFRSDKARKANKTLPP